MGSVAISQGSGTGIRTFSNAGVDSGAHQQVMTLADDTGDLLSSKLIPSGMEDALLTRAMPAQVSRNAFSMALAAGSVDPEWGAVLKTGSGQTIQQSGGNLNISTGTTVNSETIIRSTLTWAGAVRLRIRSYLSQRIVNQNFIVELVDVLGDNLAITISSATAVTVTFPGTNPFDSRHIGHAMYLGGYAGTGTFIPGRYTIASVTTNTVTYTVSGFAAGSGTVSVFGWNYHHLVYNNTNAANALWDTQRKGWNSGDTTITINTTANPGHVAVLSQNDMQASVMDATVASNSGVQYISRGSRIDNVADDVTMRLQIRVQNGTTAPASSTTWSIGHIAVSNWSPQDVNIQDVRPLANMSALPVQIANNPGLNVNTNATTNTIGAVRVGAWAQTAYALVTAATTNANLIRNGVTWLQELTISNPTATAVYVKLYNLTVAPTVGTSIPILTIRVPPTGTAGDVQVLSFGPMGKYFNVGVALAVTAGVAATDTAVAVAGVQISASYSN